MSIVLEDLGHLLERRFRFRFEGEPVRCNLCGADDYDVVGRRDRYFGKLRTVLCRRCGLVYTNPMPTEAEIAEFYARRYRKDYHGTREPRARAVARARRGAAARVKHFLPYLEPGARTLDVGAASGEFVACLAEHGFRATGLDPDAEYVDYARRRYGVDMVCARWEEARFEPGSFDLITATHVLEHFRDPATAARRCAEWLAPGGQLYLAVPNVHAPQRTPTGRFHFAHLYNFNRGALLMLARRAGFAPLEVWLGSPTNVLFLKSGAPFSGELGSGENYRVLRRHFDQHTVWRYYRTATPYKRFFAKLGRRFAEYRRLRELKSPG